MAITTTNNVLTGQFEYVAYKIAADEVMSDPDTIAGFGLAQEVKKSPTEKVIAKAKLKPESFGTMQDYLEKEPHKSLLNPQFIAGIEYEIEDVKDFHGDCLADVGIHVTKDGSLRNNGKEFITTPKSLAGVMSDFKHLFKHIELGDNPFTARTSIHVHMNVILMKHENFLALIYTYAALEPFFFNFVGKNRATNIHCVPLYDTYLSKYYKDQNPGILVSKWSKYTALNIRPVISQGSIEFRHMYGTGDIFLFTKWISYIEKLFNFSCKTTHKDLYNFWINGGTGKDLEALVFHEGSNLQEKDYFVSVMESKSAYLQG
jgi:hypothetical protein